MDTVYFGLSLVGVVTSSQTVKGKERKKRGTRSERKGDLRWRKSWGNKEKERWRERTFTPS